MQLIEGYLQGFGQLKMEEERNEEEIELFPSQKEVPRYTHPNPNNISSSSYNLQETFNHKALLKDRNNMNEKPSKKNRLLNMEQGSNNSSLSSHVSLDYYKQYQSIMKRYSSKNTYEEIHYIIILNVLFLIVILLLIIANHVMNYQGIISIFTAINNEYFNIFNIYPDLTNLKKNMISLLNVKKNFTNVTLYSGNYTDAAFNDMQKFYNEFDSSRQFILNSTFAFSRTFVENLFKNLTIIQPGYLNLEQSLNQALISLSTYIGFLTKKDFIFPKFPSPEP